MQKIETKTIVGSEQDLGYILNQLQACAHVNINKTVGSGETLQVFYTQQSFEGRAVALQQNASLVKKMGICLLTDRLIQKVKRTSREMTIVLYNGHGNAAPTTLTLSMI